MPQLVQRIAAPLKPRRLHLLRFANSAKTLCNLPAGPESVVLLSTTPAVRIDIQGELCAMCVKRFHVIR